MSATLPNLQIFADWLDASLYQTDFRPVSLVECIKFEDSIYGIESKILSKINVDKRIENDPDLLIHLVLETIVNKLGVLVFCPTKSRYLSFIYFKLKVLNRLTSANFPKM